MNKLRQMRSGIAATIHQDAEVGTITRKVMEDNGLGELIPTDEEITLKLTCRVTYQSGDVWSNKHWEGGLTIDTSSFVLAFHDSDLAKDDVLEWRGKKYLVGVVTRPSFDGGYVCTQAPLTEVQDG